MSINAPCRRVNSVTCFVTSTEPVPSGGFNIIVPSSYWSITIEDVPVISSRINISIPASSADCMTSARISSNGNPVIDSKSSFIFDQSYSTPNAKCSVVPSSATAPCGKTDAHKRTASKTAFILEKLLLMFQPLNFLVINVLPTKISL